MRKAAWLFLFAYISAHAVDVTLQWDVPSDLTGIDGYQVHHGPAPGAYDSIHDVPGATSGTTTVPWLPDDQPTYFTARSRSIDGFLVSGFSNETVYSPLAEFPPDVTGGSLVYAIEPDSPVAISKIGSFSHAANAASQASGSTSISTVTIPTGARFAVVSFAGWSGSGAIEQTNVTLDSVSMTLIDNSQSVGLDGYDTSMFVCQLLVGNEGSNKTLAWTNSLAISEGGNILIRYLAGVDTTERDSGVDECDGDDCTLDSGTLTAQTGDLFVAAASSFAAGQDVSWNSGTEIFEQTGGNVNHSWAEIDPTGNTSITAGVSYGGMCAAVLKPSTAAAPAILERNIDKYKHLLVR